MASTTGTDYSAISVSSSSMKTKSPSMTVSAPGGIVKEYEMDEESAAPRAIKSRRGGRQRVAATPRLRARDDL